MKTAPLFRGKRIDSGEFVTGNLDVNPDGRTLISYYKKPDDDWRYSELSFLVDPATVEQIAGDVVDENKQLKEQLQEIQSKPAYDVGFLYGSLAAKRKYKDAPKTPEDCAQSTNDPSDGQGLG